jgi:hypothetical protein
MPDCLEAIAKRAAVDIVDVERILSGQTPTSLVLDCAEKELLEENWLARDTRHEVHLKLDALKHLAASES